VRDGSFSASGHTFRWGHGNHGGGHDLYVRSSEKVVGPKTGKPGTRLGARGCQVQEAGVHPTLPAPGALKELVSGKYTSCGKGLLDTGGIEIDGDRWYLLRDGVRSSDAREKGTLMFTEQGTVGGTKTTNMQLKDDAGGIWAGGFSVTEAPLKIQFSMQSGKFIYSAL
jgi:hypothetical protein